MTVAPQILPFTFGDEPANWGDLMSVTCSVVKGDLPIDITWAFNNKLLKDQQDLDVVVASTNKKNSVLSIESVSAKHVGNYSCLATNRAGTAAYSANLAVNGTASPRNMGFFVFVFVFSLTHLDSLSLSHWIFLSTSPPPPPPPIHHLFQT